jgi:hypothetical protein
MWLRRPDTCLVQVSAFRYTASMMRHVSLVVGIVLLCGAFFTFAGEDNHTQLSSQKSDTPAGLQQMVDQLVHGLETFDAPKTLAVYAEDFISGTGRTIHDLRRMLFSLDANHISLQVESTEVENVEPTEAQVKTRLRLRHKDRFRGLDGEVIVTDILVHSLRKTPDGWRIYTDRRVATYRDGRFGQQPPNVQLEIPEKLSRQSRYPVTVSVQRERAKSYQVILGNYVDDAEELPSPHVVSPLPESGVLETKLARNADGLSEMVRVAVVVSTTEGELVGATLVSKLVLGSRRGEKKGPRHAA